MLFRSQMSAIGIAGIVIGILLGIAVSLGIVPYTMEMLGISVGNIKIQFYPIVVILSAFTTALAILCSLRTPIRAATEITPTEAAKYRTNNVTISRHLKKKKSAVVLLSLSMSLIVFLCLTAVINTYGERTVYPNYWNADFIGRS